MATQSERVVPDVNRSEPRPIEFLTENGYSIFRSWEIEDEADPTPGVCDFIVQCPDDLEKKVVVEIAGELFAQVEIHTCGRITLPNAFWICCAERHLADYIWEHNECPGDGQLRVEILTPGDLNLSIRWERT